VNTVRRLGLLTIATTMVAMPLTTGIAGAEPEEPKYEAVAPTDEAQLPDDFSAQHYNGEDSSVAEFPFIIAGLRTPGARPEGQSCTGAVIAPRKILTAAHCKDAQGEKSYLYGLDDLTDEGGTRLEVESYIQHPRYVNFDQGYDVAVVTMKQDIPVPNGEYAEFATSGPKYDDLNQPGKTGIGVGYEKKTHNDTPADVTWTRPNCPLWTVPASARASEPVSRKRRWSAPDTRTGRRRSCRCARRHQRGVPARDRDRGHHRETDPKHRHQHPPRAPAPSP
jgi:hypothetical protein